MSTFDSLVADLTRDAYRVQPRNALQFCANWFNKRLEEQRLAQRGAGIGGAAASVDPMSAAPAPSAGAPAPSSLFSSANPFGSAPALQVQRGSLDSASSTDTNDEEMSAPGGASGSSNGRCENHRPHSECQRRLLLSDPR